MSIVSNKELLNRAKAGHYAVAAFNVNNLEYIQAVLQAAADLKAPVIIEAIKSEIDYMDGNVFASMVKLTAEKLPIPVSLHLDHGPSYDEVIRCIRYGFTSVMYDGSMLSLDQNIANTKKVVEAAHACGVSVEAEIGAIGMAADGIEGVKKEAGLADPAECERFVHETAVDSLAAAIGNAHGFYTSKPQLHFDVLQDIEKRTGIPLVLHGGTGIPVEDIRKAISLGVAKINFASVMRKSFIDTIKASLDDGPGDYDLMKLLGAGKDSMAETAKQHIEMCMSAGKAWL